MDVPTGDYRLLLSGLENIYAASRREELWRATQEVLQMLVSADLHEVMIVGSVERDQNLYISTPGGYTDSEFAYVQEHATTHPVAMLALEQGDMGPTTLSQLMPLNTWREHEFYVESGSRRMGLDYELDATIPGVTESGFAGLAILRSGRDFSDREAQLVSSLRGHLGRVWGRVLATERLRSQGEAPPPTAALQAAFRGLTKRESEVLAWVSEGKRDSEIARILGLSPLTVSTHVRNLLSKLGVESRVAAAALALRRMGRS